MCPGRGTNEPADLYGKKKEKGSSAESEERRGDALKIKLRRRTGALIGCFHSVMTPYILYTSTKLKMTSKIHRC